MGKLHPEVFIKKFIPLGIAIIIITTIIYYNYDIYRKKDITNVIEDRLTKGILNRYKLNSISNNELTYSDDVLAIVLVSGIKDEAPHRTVSYKVLLERRNSSSWKIKDIYVIR